MADKKFTDEDIGDAIDDAINDAIEELYEEWVCYKAESRGHLSSLRLFNNRNYIQKGEKQLILHLTKHELELIAHVLYNYEQNFPDGSNIHRRRENQALLTKIDNAIENLELTEHLDRLPVVYGELIDNE